MAEQVLVDRLEEECSRLLQRSRPPRTRGLIPGLAGVANWDVWMVLAVAMMAVAQGAGSSLVSQIWSWLRGGEKKIEELKGMVSQLLEEVRGRPVAADPVEAAVKTKLEELGWTGEEAASRAKEITQLITRQLAGPASGGSGTATP
jgi:hypothetical protein